MVHVTLEIPDDLATRLGLSGEQIGKELRLAAAFSLCGQAQLSSLEAARLAGVSYREFLEAAARARVELFSASLEELKQELARPVPSGVDLEAIKRELGSGAASR